MILRSLLVVLIALAAGGCSSTQNLPEAPTTIGTKQAKPSSVPAVPKKAVALAPELLPDASAQAPVARAAPRVEPTLIYRNAPSSPPAPTPITTIVQKSPAWASEVSVEYAPTQAYETNQIGAAPARIDPSPAPLEMARPSQMKQLTAFEQSGGAPEGTYGFILMDAETGQVLSEKNADMPLAPSSMGKLLATVAILETMGPSGRFQTKVLADGSVSNGTLSGDLYLVGSGDPSLLSSDIRALAGQLAANGIRRVDGNFYFHEDAIPTTSLIDRSQPRGALYNPGVGGLNLDHNEKGGAVPISQPGQYSANAFRKYAQAAGVSIPAPKRASSEARGQEVAVHQSEPLSEILAEMFNVSRNMTAEALGAVAASQLSRKPRNLGEAASITSQWVQTQIGPIGGTGWSGFNFPNHSGLSTSHKATPRQMAEIARFGYQRFGRDFVDAFRIRAMTGNVAGTSYDIRSKIGTMSYQRGLAGIISIEGGRNMAFAIMATDPARSAGNAEAWMMKARRLEQALNSDWLQENWPKPSRTATLQ